MEKNHLYGWNVMSGKKGKALTGGCLLGEEIIFR